MRYNSTTLNLINNKLMDNTSRKLLLVDDDHIVRESVAAYLDDSGFNVLEAGDGITGFDVFKREKPDLVICDLRMPKLDGLSLLRKISDVEQVIPVPIIVISGAGGMSDVVEALRMGASDYLVKPIVDMKVLEHSIRRCLEKIDLQFENQRYREELLDTNRELQESLSVLQQDQRAGLQLQLKMFPQQNLSIKDYRIEHKLIPSLYLSGDFLDYVNYGAGGIGFFIADVSGHGSSSAFVTALLHHLSVSLARQFSEGNGLFDKDGRVEPADILKYFNDELLAVGMDKYVTMFLGMIDSDKASLRYSVAGHLPMPILYTDEKAEYLEGNGMPLGIVPDVEYKNYTQVLPNAFSLALFSDGILEVLPAEGLLQQEDCLLRTVQASQGSLQGLSTALNLDDISDAPDDIAILMVSKSGE